MATQSSGAEEQNGQSDGKYECNICFEQAKDAVVSMCGHLFCWPCIHRWMEARPDSPTCPVCKSIIDRERLIPLYGRGSNQQSDPRDKVPPRPAGQREEAQEQNEGFGMDGINISFGIGAFPFTMLGGPAFQAFGGNQRMPGQQAQGRGGDRQQRQEETRVARIFITIAILVLIMLVFA